MEKHILDNNLQTKQKNYCSILQSVTKISVQQMSPDIANWGRGGEGLIVAQIFAMISATNSLGGILQIAHWYMYTLLQVKSSHVKAGVVLLKWRVGLYIVAHPCIFFSFHIFSWLWPFIHWAEKQKYQIQGGKKSSSELKKQNKNILFSYRIAKPSQCLE